MTTYRFHSTIKKVEQRTRIVRGWKEGDTIKTEQADLGWFILLDGSWEALFVGMEKPDFEAGQTVTVSIEAKS